MTGSDTVLAGRESELTDLEQRLLGTVGAGPSVVLVEGPTGAGRTALVRGLADRLARAPEASTRLHATAWPWEADRSGGVLSRLGGPDGEGAPPDLFATAARVADAWRELPGPVLVVVDDAQHCDPATLQALTTTVHHHRDLASLVVLTRPDPDRDRPPGDADRILDRIADHVVRLGPLDATAIGRLAARAGVSLTPSLAQHLRDHTGGLARHVVALLAEVPAEAWSGPAPTLPAPSYVAAGVHRSLEEATSSTTALVEAAAVLEPPVDLVLAARLADVADVLPALDEAQRAGLLTVQERLGVTVVTLHDRMVRAAVLDRAGPARRAALHARAAEVVDDAALALLHRGAASILPEDDLADRLDAMATVRAGEGAWAGAADLLVRASRTTSDPRLRGERLVRAVDAMLGAGDTRTAAGFVPEVEALRETPMSNVVLGYLACLQGRPRQAEVSLQRAWDVVDPAADPEVAAVVAQRFVLHSLARCSGTDLVGWADRALELARPSAPAAIEAAAIRGLGLAASGRLEEAFESYAALDDQVTHGAVVQRVRMGLGWLLLQADEPERARAELEAARPTDISGGSARISLWAHAWQARAHFVTGDWDAALRVLEAGLVLVDRSGHDLVAPLLHWTAAQVHSLRGEWERAEAAIRAADVGVHTYEIMRIPSCLARAHHAEARADYAAVLRALEPLTEPWARSCVDEPGQWPWQDIWANALVIEGRPDEAAAFLDEHEPRARDRGHRSTQARLAFVRGRLVGASGDIGAARTHFERALHLLAGLPLRYDRARVHFAYGQTLRRAGKRRDADAELSTARDTYAALGAWAYVRRCERELKAGGLNSPRADRGIDELTPQEQAVTELVARGMSNREVAAELFIADKTVQYHLTRTYAKLGIRSRAELAALQAPATEND